MPHFLVPEKMELPVLLQQMEPGLILQMRLTWLPLLLLPRH
jgi:hypothetical protein